MNREEQISAYLDDELPRDEREEIERLLASDASAQRLCDELRAQRQALGQVPRLGVGQDLTDAVLRAAERRMLLDSQVARPSAEPTDWLRRARRPAIWGALVLAVGLLIMALSPEREPDGVAVAPTAPPASLEARPEPDQAGEIRRMETEQAEGLAAGRDAEAEVLGVPAAPAAGAPLREPSLGKGGAPAPGRGGFGKAGGGQTADMRREDRTVPQRSLAPAQNAPAPTQGLQFDAPTLAEGPPSGTVFICDVSPEAAAQNTFAQVLANHDVQLEAPEAQTAAAVDSAPVADEIARAEEPGLSATDTVVIEATPDQMLGILDELSQQPEQFRVAVAPPPEAQGAPQAPLPAQDYLNQLPAGGGYLARNRLRQNQQGPRNYGNARVLNRLTQSPGGPLNVEIPQAAPKDEELSQLAAKSKQAESSTQPQSADEPRQSYYVILRQAPVGSPAAPPAAEPAEPADPPEPPR